MVIYSVIYRVTECRGCEKPTEIFFEKEEDARAFMEHKASKYLEERSDLYINVDISRHLHLRFGDPDDSNGLYTMFNIDEVIVY